MKKVVSLFIVLALIISYSFVFTLSYAQDFVSNKVYCSSSSEIEAAMRLAKAGDEIIIAPGKYLLTRGHVSGSLAYSASEGTKDKHIIVRSEDPNNPAELCGSDVTTRFIMYVTGDYWEIRDLKISTGKKGIVLDHSNYSIIDNCEVYNIGEEGIHIRDNSCYTVISNTKVHDTGLYKPQYGEGIYVGSYHGETNYGRAVHYNTITHCTLGPNIAAEHIDIKEGTIGTVVEYCTMYGKGISGNNYADSFIDAKGNDAHIRFNKCYRQNNDIIVDCFQVHVQEEDAGQNNKFYGNTYYTNETETYIITANKKEGIAYYYNNIRDIAGNEYNKNCVLDETLADKQPDTEMDTATDTDTEVITDTDTTTETDTEIEEKTNIIEFESDFIHKKDNAKYSVSTVTTADGAKSVSNLKEASVKSTALYDFKEAKAYTIRIAYYGYNDTKSYEMPILTIANGTAIKLDKVSWTKIENHNSDWQGPFYMDVTYDITKTGEQEILLTGYSNSEDRLIFDYLEIVDDRLDTDTDTDMEEYPVGDVNADGKVSIVDVVLVRSHIVKMRVMESEMLLRADINSDSKVNIVDVVMIRKIIVGG